MISTFKSHYIMINFENQKNQLNKLKNDNIFKYYIFLEKF